MLGGRVIPRWYMAVSLTPYSSVGYYFHSSQPIEGAPHESYAGCFYGKWWNLKSKLVKCLSVIPALVVWERMLVICLATLYCLNSKVIVAR